MLGRQSAPCLVDGERHAHGASPPHERCRCQESHDRHRAIVAHTDSWVAQVRRGVSRRSARLGRAQRVKVDHEDFASVETDSAFADAIREHLALKNRNARLDPEMPLERYLEEDPLENHPLFKSEEQARIEETMDGEPASELSSERLPWPGEETVEDVEGPALDEALWTGRPRDFDWGD